MLEGPLFWAVQIFSKFFKMAHLTIILRRFYSKIFKFFYFLIFIWKYLNFLLFLYLIIRYYQIVKILKYSKSDIFEVNSSQSVYKIPLSDVYVNTKNITFFATSALSHNAEPLLCTCPHLTSGFRMLKADSYLCRLESRSVGLANGPTISF